MSHSSVGRSRAFGVLISALAFVTYLMLTAMPAQAAVSCSYDAVNRQVNVVSDTGSEAALRVGGGGVILFDDDDDASDGTQCDTATVNNTDGIEVDATGGGGDVEIDLLGGPFAPGETPEATGTSEIEINVTGDAADGGNDIEIEGSDDDDTIAAGDGGSGATLSEGAGAINLNGDNDADVTFVDQGNGALQDFFIRGNDGNDTINASGGAGTGNDLAMSDTSLEGGPGDDSITGTDFFDGGGLDGDQIDGEEGDDTLNGLGGDDFLDDSGVVDDLDNDGFNECDEDELDVLHGGVADELLTAGDS